MNLSRMTPDDKIHKSYNYQGGLFEIKIWGEYVYETKWPPFPRRHFQMHFLDWKICIMIFIIISLKFVLRVQLTISQHWFR